MKIAIRCLVLKETTKASLVQYKAYQGCGTFFRVQKWVPKSQFETSEVNPNVLLFSKWFFQKEMQMENNQWNPDL